MNKRFPSGVVCAFLFASAAPMMGLAQEPVVADPPAQEAPETPPAPALPPTTAPEVPETPEAPEAPETPALDPIAPPAYLSELAQRLGVTDETIASMRSDSTGKAGWGKIRNMLLIAETMSARSGGTLSLDQAVAQVREQVAAGIGLGKLARDQGLKLGGLPETAVTDGTEPVEGAAVTDGERTKAAKTVRDAKPAKPSRPERIERPAKAERVEKPVKPDRPEKPNRPERPEKPAKAEKPERPDRGNRR